MIIIINYYIYLTYSVFVHQFFEKKMCWNGTVSFIFAIILCTTAIYLWEKKYFYWKRACASLFIYGFMQYVQFLNWIYILPLELHGYCTTKSYITTYLGLIALIPQPFFNNLSIYLGYEAEIEGECHIKNNTSTNSSESGYDDEGEHDRRERERTIKSIQHRVNRSTFKWPIIFSIFYFCAMLIQLRLGESQNHVDSLQYYQIHNKIYFTHTNRLNFTNNITANNIIINNIMPNNQQDQSDQSLSSFPTTFSDLITCTYIGMKGYILWQFKFLTDTNLFNFSVFHLLPLTIFGMFDMNQFFAQNASSINKLRYLMTIQCWKNAIHLAKFRQFLIAFICYYLLAINAAFEYSGSGESAAFWCRSTILLPILYLFDFLIFQKHDDTIETIIYDLSMICAKTVSGFFILSFIILYFLGFLTIIKIIN